MPRLVGQVSRRVVRGLVLWRGRRHEMRVDAAGYWLVPSRSQPGLTHWVSADGNVCGCGDARFSSHRCMHGWAVLFEAALRTALARSAGADDPHGTDRGFGRRPR